ncbi:hypothetical protein Trydic_g5642 [Trypoxylus dichotomus]
MDEDAVEIFIGFKLKQNEMNKVKMLKQQFNSYIVPKNHPIETGGGGTPYTPSIYSIPLGGEIRNFPDAAVPPLYGKRRSERSADHISSGASKLGGFMGQARNPSESLIYLIPTVHRCPRLPNILLSSPDGAASLRKFVELENMRSQR